MSTKASAATQTDVVAGSHPTARNQPRGRYMFTSHSTRISSNRSEPGSSLRRVLAVCVSAILAVLLAASPAAAATGTVKTSGLPLTVRSAPSTTASAIGSLSNGTAVTITCQTYGTSVTGTYGTSKVWDKIASGGYVSDTYLHTGSDGLVAPLCDSSSPTTNKLLDYADNYVGRLAKYACLDAGITNTNGTWQCKQFVSCAVAKAYGRNIQGGYYSPYLNNGFVKVSRADARAGDVVQLNKSTNRETFYTGMHTAILAGGFGGDNTATVVDSNYGGDPRGSEVVRKHSWDPYLKASQHGLQVSIFRYVG